MDSPKFLLIDSSVLPEVFHKVIQAKNLLATGQAKNSSEAARLTGLSRSAFYKYKDSIHEYDSRMNNNLVTLYFSLVDQPGVLSSVINCLYTLSANIITINQNIPTDGVAPVTMSVRLGAGINVPTLLKKLNSCEGVVKAKEI